MGQRQKCGYKYGPSCKHSAHFDKDKMLTESRTCNKGLNIPELPCYWTCPGILENGLVCGADKDQFTLVGKNSSNEPSNNSMGMGGMDGMGMDGMGMDGMGMGMDGFDQYGGMDMG